MSYLFLWVSLKAEKKNSLSPEHTSSALLTFYEQLHCLVPAELDYFVL